MRSPEAIFLNYLSKLPERAIGIYPARRLERNNLASKVLFGLGQFVSPVFMESSLPEVYRDGNLLLDLNQPLIRDDSIKERFIPPATMAEVIIQVGAVFYIVTVSNPLIGLGVGLGLKLGANATEHLLCDIVRFLSYRKHHEELLREEL